MKLLRAQHVVAWILAIFISFFVVGFLGNFHGTFFDLLFIAFLSQLISLSFFVLLLTKSRDLYSSRPFDFYLSLLLFVLLLTFVLGMFGMLKQFPSLFDPKYFFPKNGQLFPSFVGIFLAFPVFIFGRNQWMRSQFVSRFLELCKENLVGILISVFFFTEYLLGAVTFNQPSFDVDDIFFDTDGLLWRTRFTTDVFRDYYWRSVHPFVLLIIRPIIAFVSLFLDGNRLSAAFLLVAFSGALCVFFVWYFVKHKIQSGTYALLIATLLGFSAAHLVFGSLLETYIFLAVVAILFMVVLLKHSSFFSLIVLGILSFGITFTNFAQMVIAFILVKRDFVQWVKYGLIVVALVIPLSMLNNIVYPDSQPYFFDISSFGAEASNTFSPSIARGLAIVRVMAFHSIVAPDPLILHEEIPFLKVWMSKMSPIRLGTYKTILGAFLGYAWFGFILIGLILFLKNIFKEDNRFQFTFILILLFNFLLHLRYGKDLFLYSTNWTYAVVLFFAFAWKDIATHRWFQVALFVFITLLLLNNSRLIHTMLETSALHIK
ncbi:MAG: hypothetical protein U0Z26_05295 [Anaerolineales bacterium]